MKKIAQGKYELSITKADAIDKFMEIQGICREELSGKNPIGFYCSENGKILITYPQTTNLRRSHNKENSTELFAEIIECDGKTYVSYYTAFSKTTNVLKKIYNVIYLLTAIFAIFGTIIGEVKTYYFPILILLLIIIAIDLFDSIKEKENSPNDSEVLIKELEKRVEAVILWDK